MQDFDAAATRHYNDAELLHDNDRLPNADALAGVATECALKEILVHFLGAQQTSSKPQSNIAGQWISHGHLPSLWGQVSMIVAGRLAGSTFMGMFTTPNPFDSWSIDDRYKSGAGVTAETVRRHLDVARELLGHLEQAKKFGALR